MNRETIVGALLSKLTGPPMVFGFTADTTAGSTALANVSDATGLMVGMPVAGSGLSPETTIAALSPVTLSLPALLDSTATALVQGFLTTGRRLVDANAEQDMPALYLVELNEMHNYRQSNAPALVELNCEVWLYTRVGAEANAVPAAMLNVLIDALERALYPTPTGFRQNLGVAGVHYARIEGEVQKDPGHSGHIAMAVVPIKILVAQSVT